MGDGGRRSVLWMPILTRHNRRRTSTKGGEEEMDFRLVRCARVAVSICGLAAFTGCGETTGGTGDDCDVHGGCDGPFALESEGGDVRLEIFRFADNSEVLNSQGWFFEGQSPGVRPLDGDPVVDPIDGIEYCQDQTMYDDRFDQGPSQRLLEIVNSRTYLDMGSSITLEGPVDITLTKHTDTVDPSSGFFEHDIMYLGDIAPEDLPRDASYALSGFDVGTGQDPLGNEWEGASIYMPADFEATWASDSSTAAVAGLGGISFQKGDKLTITWTQPPADAPRDMALFAVIDGETGMVTHGCVTENTGEMVVPAVITNAVPDAGFIVHGMVQHHAYDYEGRRLDLQGLNCELWEYSAQ